MMKSADPRTKGQRLGPRRVPRKVFDEDDTFAERSTRYQIDYDRGGDHLLSAAEPRIADSAGQLDKEMPAHQAQVRAKDEDDSFSDERPQLQGAASGAAILLKKGSRCRVVALSREWVGGEAATGGPSKMAMILQVCVDARAVVYVVSAHFGLDEEGRTELAHRIGCALTSCLS